MALQKNVLLSAAVQFTLDPMKTTQVHRESDVSPSPVEEKPVAPEISHVPLAVEIGGRRGPEPTRYGDWEKNGRCIDF